MMCLLLEQVTFCKTEIRVATTEVFELIRVSDIGRCIISAADTNSPLPTGSPLPPQGYHRAGGGTLCHHKTHNRYLKVSVTVHKLLIA